MTIDEKRKVHFVTVAEQPVISSLCDTGVFRGQILFNVSDLFERNLKKLLQEHFGDCSGMIMGVTRVEDQAASFVQTANIMKLLPVGIGDYLLELVVSNSLVLSICVEKWFQLKELETLDKGLFEESFPGFFQVGNSEMGEDVYSFLSEIRMRNCSQCCHIEENWEENYNIIFPKAKKEEVTVMHLF